MDKTLKDILRDEMQAKGMSLTKLREQTGIAERYLSALLEGTPGKLPPAPYVRGYLVKIGPVLGLDSNLLYERYRAEGEVKSSGANDLMPKNRFALRHVNRKLVGGVIIGIALVVYLIVGADRYLGRPRLTLANPATDTVVTAASLLTISGTTDPGNTIAIDGEAVLVDPQGHFEKEYSLDPGMNTISITAENPVIGRKTEVVRTVIATENSQ